MSAIKEKSRQNFEAGDFLIKNNFYAASIHCFYYSCIQLLKFILINNYNKSEVEIDRESIDSKKGFHNWLINFFYNAHKEINDKHSTIIHQKLFKLKKYRVESDYKNVGVTYSKSITAKNISSEILLLLKEDYEL